MLALPLCSGFLSGCSLLSPKSSSLSDYEEARRKIEREQEEMDEAAFRPEGKTAERESSLDFMQKLGFSKERRKDRELARSHYQEADAIFEEARGLEGSERIAKFREAAGKYQQAGDNWKSSGLEQDALLSAAESLFFAEDYYQAEQLYAELVKEYPKNQYLDHIDSRRFEIADYWLRTDAVKKTPFVVVNFVDRRFPWNDTGGHGERVLEQMRLDNPTGKISDDATMRLAMEAYESGKFEEAADAFSDLRLTYPDSDHQFIAQFLELQSLLASYQGPVYSSVPLTDAQKRLKQIARQFPQEASGKEVELQESYAKIRFLMAERVWTQAKYRRARGENGSARFHYERILEEYSDTPFADKARAALEDIKDKPADPPQRFKALVWLFGEADDGRPWRKKN